MLGIYQYLRDLDMEESLNTNNSESVLSEKLVIILRIFYFLFLIILGFIYQYFNSGVSSKDFIPTSIGSAVGLGIISFIIAFVRLLRKKKPTKGIYITYFAISAVMFFFTFIGVINQKSYSENYSNKYNNSEILEQEEDYKSFIYRYSGNEYSVSFERKPKITNSSAPFNGTFLKFETAELVIPEYKSFFRAECFNLDKGSIRNVNKEYIYNYLNEYSKYTGLSYPTFQYEETALGKIGSLRAYKTLIDDDGNERKITYFSQTFYGEHSVMIIYVGCPSEDYPTSSISRFINSVNRN